MTKKKRMAKKKHARRVHRAKSFDTGFVSGEPVTRHADELICKCPKNLIYPYTDIPGISEHRKHQAVNGASCACTLFEVRRGRKFKHGGKYLRTRTTPRTHLHVRHVAITGEIRGD